MKDMFIDLAKYRIQRAFENKGDAEILLKSNNLVDSVNRIFLANYYGVKSLLATKMKDSPKHQQVLRIFQENFIQTGEVPKEYGQIVDKSYRSRDEGERTEQLQISAREAEILLEECERFLSYVREYLKQFILSNPRKSGEAIYGNNECGEEKNKNKKKG